MKKNISNVLDFLDRFTHFIFWDELDSFTTNRSAFYFKAVIHGKHSVVLSGSVNDDSKVSHMSKVKHP